MEVRSHYRTVRPHRLIVVERGLSNREIGRQRRLDVVDMLLLNRKAVG